MSKICPITKNIVISQDCVDCDKACRNMNKKVSIGIDQSYKNTGISICVQGKLKVIKSVPLEHLKSNTEKRDMLKNELNKIIDFLYLKGYRDIVCIIERIRLRSQGFLNIDYIKSIGALNALIVDCCKLKNIPVFSVDTRCWKSQVVGTSKEEKNDFGVDPKKWPTIKWLINEGFENKILQEITSKTKKKGVFLKNDKKYKYNDDASDSAAIAKFYFVGDLNKLKEEK